MTDTAPAGSQRIGVFGGAFDPPHRAHVALAEAALAQLALDTLYVIPTGQAWHKPRTLTAPEHRLAMTRLAFAGMDRVTVDDREIRRAGPSFTIDTLEALQAEHPGAQFYLVIGNDQFAALKTWHRWEAVLELAIICIANRADSTRAGASFDPKIYPGHAILTLKTPLMPVSATDIRGLISSASGGPQGWTHLVPEPVARYIERHRLYISS